MKKAVIILLLLGICVFAVYSENTSLKTITLTAIVGQVEVKPSTDVPFQPGKEGMNLAVEATLKTGNNSYCELSLDADNVFRLKENSTLVIDQLWNELTKQDGKVVRVLRFKLLDGELTAKLDKIPEDSEVSVASPVAIAGAIGTEFVVSHQKTLSKSTVAVLDNTVQVTSIGDRDREIQLSKFQRTNIAPWTKAVLRSRGTGILSKKILGKEFVKKAKETIHIQGVGEGPTMETARFNAYQDLSKTALQLKVDQDRSIEDIIAKDTTLLEKFFRTISQANVIKAEEIAPGKFRVSVNLEITKLNETLGISIKGLTQNIAPISRQEYSTRFGAHARVTTERAAKVDAYRKLAELIYGTVITSKTTLKDMAVSQDTITTRVEGIVRGAQPVSSIYYSDGTISMNMKIRGDIIPQSLTPITGNVFGNNYMSSPEPLVFKDFSDYYNFATSKPR